MSSMVHAENNGPLGEDLKHEQTIQADGDPREGISRIRTAGAITIPPEIFEKLYLTPANKVKGDLRYKFANPTPLSAIAHTSPCFVHSLTKDRGLVGFVMALTPLCCALMGWRGAGGGGAAEMYSLALKTISVHPPILSANDSPFYSGPFYWFGGALQLIAGVLEFILGNTFPFVVLSSFGTSRILLCFMKFLWSNTII